MNRRSSSGKSTKKQSKINTPMVTDFGIRKISNQNFSKVIAIPKTALANCGSSRTSKLKVELVPGKRFYIYTYLGLSKNRRAIRRYDLTF